MEVGPVGSATAGRIVSPRLVLVALRQIRGKPAWRESASEVRALFPGWARRRVPKPGQIAKAMSA
jgi:hypothetical protein